MARLGAWAFARHREETLRMLSIPDMAILGAAALLFFGPEQLPKVARKAGLFMRDVQNTSQTFIREMERAADEGAGTHTSDYATTYPAYDPSSWETPITTPPVEPIDEGPLHAEVDLVAKPVVPRPVDELLHAEVDLVAKPKSYAQEHHDEPLHAEVALEGASLPPHGGAPTGA